MATVTFVGKQRAQAQVGTLTVGTADTGGTITVTVGGTASVVITPTTTNTTTTAEELLAALQAAAQANPVFAELTWEQDAAVVTFTGPADGSPIVISKTDGGSNATTLDDDAVADPLSPFDLADAANYSGGALPSNGDTLVMGSPAKYGLTALAAVGLAEFVRPAGVQVGLPDVNPAGYPEFRTTYMSLKSTLATIDVSNQDGAGAVRLNLVTTACTLTVRGDQGGGQLGGEALHLKGSAAATAVNLTGGSFAACPGAEDTLTMTTLRAIGATVRVGPGCTLGTPTIFGGTVLLEASWSSGLTVDGGAAVTVGRAATGTMTLDSGSVLWLSTANPGNSPAIGSGAALDLSQAPSGLTIGGTVALNAGCTLNDAAGRGGNYAVQTVRCTLAEVNWITPNGKTFTLS